MAKIKNPSDKLEAAKNIASKSKENNQLFDAIGNILLRFFRWFSSTIDRIFFSQKTLPVFALLLAVLMYVSVNVSGENSIFKSLSSAKTINNVSVSARYNSESFEVTGVPKTCTVVITGEAANVNNAASKSGYCLLDLEGYTEGTSSVKLTAVGYGENVNITVTPSEAQITLKKKTTVQFDLSYDFINTNQMDSRYILGTPVFSNETKINIRASQDTLNSIALVKALIDVSGQTSDFTIDAPLVAYDKNGRVVEAEIVPNTVTATVKVTSPNKVVPITVRVTGTAPVGYSIDSVTMDRQSTTIYATEAVLNEIKEVFVSVDLSTISGDTKLSQAITLPNGVTSSEVTMVNLEITLAETQTKVLRNIPILYRNNDRGYGAITDTTSVDVTVSGAADVINSITGDNITVYIDVAGVETGTQYTLPLLTEINGGQYATFTLSQNEIVIEFSN